MGDCMDDEILIREADPDTGLTVVHRRKLDTLATLARYGTITADMHDVASRYQTAFYIAHIGRSGPAWLGERVDGGNGDGGSERLERARRFVADCSALLGGMGSMQASAVWHICGNGLSIREWRQRAAWNDFRLRDDKHAAGVLVAALDCLVRWASRSDKRT